MKTKITYPSVVVDSTIRPQDDFFSYVNNPWIAAHAMPASESRWGTFNVLRDQAWHNLNHIYELLQSDETVASGSTEQQARDFYFTAMHADEFAEQHLALIGSCCQKIDAVTNMSELSAIIGELHAMGGNAPWSAYVEVDDTDSSRHIFRIHQAGLALPNRDYYLDTSAKMVTIRNKYSDHLLKLRDLITGLHDDAQIFSHTVISFEQQLAAKSRTNANLREVEKNYHKISFAQLQKDYPRVDWRAYAASLGWNPHGQLSVDQPEFMAFINDQFVEELLGDWKTYLKWHLVAKFYGKVSERFAQFRFEFFGAVLSGTQQILPQWKRAVLVIDEAIGPAVGRLYASNYFPESSKLKVLDIVEQVRSTYSRRLERLAWMAEETKKLAQQKLANTKVLIGYPDEWRDFSKLVVGRQSYLQNIIAAERFDTAYYLHKLTLPTSRDEWLMDPQTVNAYSDSNRLVICFPAAILQPPFFDPAAPSVVNLGGIGTVIGHEFTHGFDDQGYKFDPSGNMREWQTAEDRRQFNSRAQVIIDQADAFEVLPGVRLNGKLVVGESIADLGGIEIAFEAYVTAAKRHSGSAVTTREFQRFFLA